MPIGIMSAMHEEIHLLHEQMIVDCETVIGMRTYYSGSLWGKEVVLVFSRWGKVAAASTATTLIDKFGVDELIFSGVAGGIDAGLKIGDVVIGSKLIQHDMDASPLFEKFEIPLIKKKYFDTDTKISEMLYNSASHFIVNNELEDSIRNEFSLHSPSIYRGIIASGDKFVSDKLVIERLRAELPDLMCVEMEGAAVAQVCYEYGVPFGIVRIISDSADDEAHIDFIRFVDKVASQYTVGILKNYFEYIIYKNFNKEIGG